MTGKWIINVYSYSKTAHWLPDCNDELALCGFRFYKPNRREELNPKKCKRCLRLVEMYIDGGKETDDE